MSRFVSSPPPRDMHDTITENPTYHVNAMTFGWEIKGPHIYMVVFVCEMAMSAISHMSREPWLCNCESPTESVQRPSQHTSKNHVVRSWILKCSVKSYVTGPSTKCYFNNFLFMRILKHD